MKCLLCKAPMGTCDCWERCSCGWSTYASTPCCNAEPGCSTWEKYPFLSVAHYRGLRRVLVTLGYQDEIMWAQNLGPCTNADDFALEHAFVVCNSGMKAQIARPIFERIKERLLADGSIRGVFGHVGKVRAIEYVWDNRRSLYAVWRDKVSGYVLDVQLTWLHQLPWIGPITKYHLAKNLGVECCKPDRHLVQLAGIVDETPDALCARLAKENGDRVVTVDTVLWRSANLGHV